MLEIPLPPGYRSAVPFDKQKHKRRGVIKRPFLFARHLNVVYLTTAEFNKAGHDYPIAFARQNDTDFAPVILTGLEAKSNLFLNDAGDWSKHHYCPAYVRRYPFFTVVLADQEDGERALICVDEKALTTDAPSLINAAGEPTARWRELEILVNEMEREQAATLSFCRRIDALKVLEPFEADIHPRGKPEIRVTGLWRVNERSLKALDEAQQLKLLQDGDLARIYAHLSSFENLNRLLDRHVATPS